MAQLTELRTELFRAEALSEDEEPPPSFIRRRAIRAQASHGWRSLPDLTAPSHVHHHHHHHHLTQRTMRKATLEIQRLSAYSQDLMELHREVLHERQQLLAQQPREPRWFDVVIPGLLLVINLVFFFHLYNRTTMY